MAFVFDANDPGNLGMFSKAGRFTSEKHIIFQKKDEILNNQRKFLKVTSLPQLRLEFEVKDPNKLLDNEHEEEKPKDMLALKNKPKIEPFALQVSRDSYYDSRKVKHPPPPCGFYNPKHKLTEKQAPTLFQYSKEKSTPNFFSTMNNFTATTTTTESVSHSNEKTHKKVVSPTPLHLQTGRKSMISPKDNPHESRFFFFETPKSSTLYKRPRTADIGKSLGRERNTMYKNAEYSPDYNPNFEFGKKGLGSSGPAFEKVSTRKKTEYVSPSINQDFFDTSKKEGLKFKRPQTAAFDHYSPRESNPSSPLPSFMQKTINTRFAIGGLSQKALETNNFSDGKFQTMYSSFSPTKFKSTL